jgi:hypothetical protein
MSFTSSRERDPLARRWPSVTDGGSWRKDGARPIIYYYGPSATCWQPRVKGLTVMVNSIVNGWRMEDVRFDK